MAGSGRGCYGSLQDSHVPVMAMKTSKPMLPRTHLRRGVRLAALAACLFAGLAATHAAQPSVQPLLEGKWPDRYNEAGHVTWGGRIYGRGLTLAAITDSM